MLAVSLPMVRDLELHRRRLLTVFQMSIGWLFASELRVYGNVVGIKEGIRDFHHYARSVEKCLAADLNTNDESRWPLTDDLGGEVSWGESGFRHLHGAYASWEGRGPRLLVLWVGLCDSTTRYLGLPGIDRPPTKVLQVVGAILLVLAAAWVFGIAPQNVEAILFRPCDNDRAQVAEYGFEGLVVAMGSPWQYDPLLPRREMLRGRH